MKRMKSIFSCIFKQNRARGVLSHPHAEHFDKLRANGDWLISQFQFRS